MRIPNTEFRLELARWGVVFLLAGIAASAYLTRHALAVANTTIQSELKIDNEQFGYLYAAFSLGYLLFQIPGGWLGQRTGVRFALPLCAILWSLSTFTTAFVSTLTGLIVIRFLFGLAQAGLVPNQAMALRDWIPEARRGLASSAMLVAMSVGGIASLSLTSWLMKYAAWRTLFAGYSLLGVGWAVLFALVFRSSPREYNWLRSAEMIEEMPSTGEIRDPVISPEVDGRRSLDLFGMISSRSLWGLSIQAMLKASGYNLIVTFLPALLEYIYKVPPQDVGWLSSWSLITFVGGSLVGGVVVDRVYDWSGSKYISRSIVACLTLTIAACFTALSGFGGTATATAACLAAGALFSGVASSAPWVAVMDIGGRNTAVVMGFMNSFSALGGVLFSPLAGRLIDHTKSTDGDWSLVFLLHGSYYFIAALAWLMVDPLQSLKTTGGGDVV